MIYGVPAPARARARPPSWRVRGVHACLLAAYVQSADESDDEEGASAQEEGLEGKSHYRKPLSVILALVGS